MAEINETTVNIARSRKFWSKRAVIMFAVPVLLLVAFGVTIGGLYLARWNNFATSTLIAIVPLPAGKVGDQKISTKDYFARVKLLQAENRKGTFKNVDKQAFTDLVNERLLAEYAKAHKLSPDTKAVKQFVAAQQKANGNHLSTEALSEQATGVALTGQVNRDLAKSSEGKQLAEQQVAQVLPKLALDSPSLARGGLISERKSTDVMIASSLLANLPQPVQDAFKGAKLGQEVSEPIATPQGFFVGKYVKDDAQKKPIINYALIHPTVDQWLNSKNISGSSHGYLSQIK